jgi:hypothetical protein
MGDQTTGNRELVNLAVCPIHYIDLVVPGVDGNPLRVDASDSQRIETGPCIVRRANQPIRSRIQVIDFVGVIVGKVKMSIEWIPGHATRFVCHRNQGGSDVRNIGGADNGAV